MALEIKNYNLISKLFHSLVLSSSLSKRAALDMDSLLNSNKKNINIKSPVYIAGLARAGTTILLEALYSTNQFTSLTYRDMPFAIAPFFLEKNFFQFLSF